MLTAIWVMSVLAGPVIAASPSSAAPGGRHQLRGFELEHGRKAGAGQLVIYRHRHRGVDVVGGRAVLRYDRHGVLRWSNVRAPEVPDDLAVQPRIDALRALTIAFGDAVASRLPLQRHARVVVLAPPHERARLAWELRYADELRPASWRVYVDAVTGDVLARDNLARRAAKHRARVYEVNPIVDDRTTHEVTFGDLAESATLLDDAEVGVVNCIDERQCHAVKTAAGVRDVHFCELVPTATAGPDGDFLHITPASDTANEDRFAEVQMYFHTKKALDAFRGFAGDESFALHNKLTAVVNMRVPDLSSDVSACRDGKVDSRSKLLREDNAYFWPAGELGPVELGDRIVMSQGFFADWAYDGEVVYHEVTHAVMHTVTPLGWLRLDRRGLDPSPGGLHEGFSDYFAATITGNAELNLYAGTTADGPAPISSLLDTHRCTEVMTGEEHDESHAWSEALWAIRRSLRSAAKRAMFDRALFRVISALGRFDNMETATGLLLAELDVATEEFITDNALDSVEAGKLRDTVGQAPDKLASRGLPGCNGRVLPTKPGQIKDSLYVRGPYTWSSPVDPGQLLPATMQFELALSRRTSGIKLEADVSYALSDELVPADQPRRPELVLLVKRGAPIEWTWNGRRGTHDAELELPIDVEHDSDAFASAIARGDFPAGKYYLQLANRGADWGLESMWFVTANADGSFDGSFGDGKADAPGTTRPVACAASPGHDGPLPGTILLLAALAVTVRRRGVARATSGSR